MADQDQIGELLGGTVGEPVPLLIRKMSKPFGSYAKKCCTNIRISSGDWSLRSQRPL